MEIATPAPNERRLSGGRIAAASTVALLALLLVSAAGAGLVAAARGDHGYIMTGTHPYSTSGRAIVSGTLDADGIPNWLAAKFRVAATSADGKPLFVGVAKRADVDRYLAGVARSTVEDVNFNPFNATYSNANGTKTPAPPATQTFWAQSHTGAGKQTVSWNIRSGDWRVVVMNADASPSVTADAKVGTTIRGALPVTISVLAGGILLLVAAAAIVLAPRRK